MRGDQQVGRVASLNGETMNVGVILETGDGLRGCRQLKGRHEKLRTASRAELSSASTTNITSMCWSVELHHFGFVSARRTRVYETPIWPM